MEEFYSILMDLTFTIKNDPLGGIKDIFLEHARYCDFHPMFYLYYAWKTNLEPYLKHCEHDSTAVCAINY